MHDGVEQKEASERSLARTIFKNTGFITTGTIALKAINFLFGVYVVRRLGDARFGQYSIVLAFVGIFQILAELGMSQYVMREMARDKKNIEKYFWNLVALRLILALAAMVFIPVSAYFVGYSPELILGVVIYTSSFILSAFSAPLASVLTASERLDITTIINIVSQIVFMIFGAIFLFSGLGYIWLIVALLISVIPSVAIGLITIRRLNISYLPFQLNPRIWPGIIRAGLPFGIISLMLSIARSIDTVMLSWYEPDQVVGWYNVSYNLVLSMMVFYGGFKEAIVPSLSRVFMKDPQQVERWYYHSVRMIILASIPMAFGGMVIAFPLIRFLYTDQFLPSAVGMQILIWDIPVLMFASFCGNITTVVGQERAAARINTINTIANVGLNLLFIPMYGLVGAAIISVVTDLISALQFYLLLRKQLHLPSIAWLMARTIVAAFIMAVPVHLLIPWASGWRIFLAIGVGMAVYLPLLVAFRLVGKAEWSVVKRIAHRVSVWTTARRTAE